MRRLQGLGAVLRGGDTELRFFSAMQSPEWRSPYWYVDCRRATQDEDAKGIDAFVKIDVGVVPVQIKSSFAGLEEDRKHYGHNHCVVIITEKLTAQEIRTKTTNLLYRWRGKLMRDSQKNKGGRKRKRARK